MEYILWILWVAIGYLTLGFMCGAYTIFSLWNIGHFELPKEKRLNLVWAFTRVVVLWGTIFFRKKAKPMDEYDVPLDEYDV